MKETARQLAALRASMSASNKATLANLAKGHRPANAGPDPRMQRQPKRIKGWM